MDTKEAITTILACFSNSFYSEAETAIDNLIEAGVAKNYFEAGVLIAERYNDMVFRQQFNVPPLLFISQEIIEDDASSSLSQYINDGISFESDSLEDFDVDSETREKIIDKYTQMKSKNSKYDIMKDKTLSSSAKFIIEKMEEKQDKPFYQKINKKSKQEENFRP